MTPADWLIGQFEQVAELYAEADRLALTRPDWNDTDLRTYWQRDQRITSIREQARRAERSLLRGDTDV